MTKRAHTQALKGFVTLIGGVLADIDAKSREHAQYIGRRMTEAVIAAHRAEEHVLALGGDWMTWAKETFPGTPDSTLYRYRNAGTVAALIQDAGGDVSEVGYTAFVPPYRLLKSAKSDAEKETARVEIIARWAKLTAGGRVPEVSDVEDAFADTAPTRGKGAGDAETTTANRKAAKSRRAKKSATAPGPEVASGEGPTKSDEEIRANVEKEVARIMSRYDANVLPGVKSAILAGIKLAETFDPGVAFAVVKGYKVS